MPQDTAACQRDYSLTGPEAARAAEKGLVSAEWYQSPISRQRMKQLMQRRDGPALLDTAIWLLALLVSGFGGYWFWGSWACVPFLRHSLQPALARDWPRHRVQDPVDE
ncbi:MocD [Pseudomonas syringae pv. rhaphiolepidis]|nr:MocD [Pseudomonas syringae pv. rhaphiolepidis]